MLELILLLALPVSFAAGAIAAVGHAGIYAAAASVLYWIKQNLPR